MEKVKTDAGFVSGTLLGNPGNQVNAFLGIPFAAPPVGDFRWRPPQPVVHWSGIRSCNKFSKQAPHGSPMSPEPEPLEMSEDCLYLNVLTPAKTPTDHLPVMVWLHGGGLFEGNANRTINNGPGLPRHGVVLVSVNMRLNVLGLMAHPLLSSESPRRVSGNYLFLDMIAALKWVQQNIAAFGGDPGNVTIFGQSGGGMKVTGLMSSPLAHGLFHRAVIESGAGLKGLLLSEVEHLGERLFTILGVHQTSDPLAAARSLPWEEVIDAHVALEKDLSVTREPVAIDGWFLADTPQNVFKAGKHNAVPLIVGSTMGELPTHGLRMQHIPYYLDLIAGNHKLGVDGYAYVFNQVPGQWRREGCIACHAMELPYLFGTWNEQSAWDVLYVVACNNDAGAKTPQAGVDAGDQKVSEALMSMWTHFARTGNPSVEGTIEWPAYEPNNDRYLYISNPLVVKSGFSKVI